MVLRLLLSACLLRQVRPRLLQFLLIILPGILERLLELFNVIKFLLAEVHLTVGGLEDLVHLVLVLLDLLEGATHGHKVGRHLLLSHGLGAGRLCLRAAHLHERGSIIFLPDVAEGVSGDSVGLVQAHGLR